MQLSYRSKPTESQRILLLAKFISKLLNIYLEFDRNYLFCSRRVVFCVMARPRIESRVGEQIGDTELARNKRPIPFKSFESSNEIGEDLSIRVDEPIELI